MNIQRTIRIGTRDSKLALWQANQVKLQLEKNDIACEIVAVKSEGDIDLTTPLYAMGVEGVFTRTLDASLLSNKIDIAVHSMKDVPIQLAQGIVQAAVLPRGSYKDILIARNEETLNDLNNTAAIIATSSIRRRAQWLHRYPEHTIDNLRGNVQTRLQKLEDSNWHGAIFAAAGIERLGIDIKYKEELDWMLPAPAQGAIMVVCREEDNWAKVCCAPLNDEATATCVKAERDFLAALMGGCATPISALAVVQGEQILFKGNVTAPDGKESITWEDAFDIKDKDKIGDIAATSILALGASDVITKMKD